MAQLVHADRDVEATFEPRKWPSQRRSRETFEAVVQACTLLLPERGYARTTTNHIARRAGVNIASLYEYFPGKDAIVAQVAERLVERVLSRLAAGAATLEAPEAPETLDGGESQVVRRWIELIHDTVARERELIAVFLYQVPYTQQLPAMRALRERLLAFSQQMRREAGGFVQPGFTDSTLHLTVNLVTSTIMQLVEDPPRDVAPWVLLDELILRVDEWIRGPIRGPTHGPIHGTGPGPR